MTMSPKQVKELNDTPYSPNRAISDRYILEDLIRIHEVLKHLVQALKIGDNLINYEVATFQRPAFTVQGPAIPRKLYLFVADKVLAFWSPEISGWVVVSQNMG